MSIMDLYRKICMERFDLNEPAKPIANKDTEEPSKKVKKKIKEPSASKSSVKKRSSSVDSAKPPTKKCKVVKVAKCTPSHKMTDDGFKIVSEMDLPSDDSDISDAFESEDDNTDEKIEQAESKKVDKAIKTYISDNDSDISDAFDSEGSDCEEYTDGKEIESSVKDRSTAETSSCNKSSGKFGLVKNNAKSMVDKRIVDGKSSEGEPKTKKRKRGSRNKNKSSTGIGAKPNNSKTIPQFKKKDKDKKNRKPKKEKVELSKDDIEAIKAKIPPKVQKIISEFGLDWAKFDTPAEREKRDLAKLPQPEQIPNCTTYLKKDPVSGKIITVYDYSKKRGGTPSLAGAAKAGSLNAPKSGSQTVAVVSSGMKQAGVVSKTATVSRATKNAKPGDVPLTKEQLERIEKNKQMKAEHLEELRALKRNIVNNVINKSLDPRTKDQKRLTLIAKLGGVVKKPCLNYKVLMANKKKEKQEAEIARENLKNLGMHDMLKKKRRQFRKKDPNEVSGFNSLGGRIRDGVMVIGKKDIARLNA